MYEIAVNDGGHYLFIRFNTDVEKDKKGNKVPTIPNKRLKKLKEVVEYLITMEILPRFMVVFMFYSEERFEEIKNQFVNGR